MTTLNEKRRDSRIVHPIITTESDNLETIVTPTNNALNGKLRSLNFNTEEQPIINTKEDKSLKQRLSGD
jgi:hypothetical protein